MFWFWFWVRLGWLWFWVGLGYFGLAPPTRPKHNAEDPYWARPLLATQHTYPSCVCKPSMCVCLRGEVMRQAVTARRLASSPPAPSPSKRPKRTGPQLPPRELSRLADKQLTHLRGLLSGAERPYPTHCGLDSPVSELVRFITKAYASWKAVSFWGWSRVGVCVLDLGFGFWVF